MHKPGLGGVRPARVRRISFWRDVEMKKKNKSGKKFPIKKLSDDAMDAGERMGKRIAKDLKGK